MSKIVIIGAGAMGSAFALPCLDNNHDVNIIGTHLENEFIDNLKKIKICIQVLILKFQKMLRFLNLKNLMNYLNLMLI